jgi:hypothetical protein
MKGNGKMACTACGKNFNPFSAIHEKVIKEDGFHFFWAIFTPHFIERLEERVPDAEVEDVLEIAGAIEKVAKRKKFQCTRWRGKHIIWKYKFNERRKRLELEFISIVPLGKFNVRLHTGYYVKDVEYVEVDINE